MGKGEIARYEQFLLIPQCFQKACFPGVSKGVIVWEWVKDTKFDTKKEVLKYNDAFYKQKTKVSRSPLRQRSVTAESVSTMDLGGKDEYIHKAANQICIAQELEANSNFEQAFATYKFCVEILLTGVQGTKFDVKIFLSMLCLQRIRI